MGEFGCLEVKYAGDVAGLVDRVWGARTLTVAAPPMAPARHIHVNAAALLMSLVLIAGAGPPGLARQAMESRFGPRLQLTKGCCSNPSNHERL